jgi:hypothetical protein
MSTNDETETTDTEVEEVSSGAESTTDLEAELREAKAQADKLPAEEADKDKTEAVEESKDSTLTTEVPSHDLEWYKKAYEQSTTEALRLKGELDKKVEAPQVTETSTETSDDSVLTPEQLYVKQMLIKESDEAFAGIVEKYPSVKDPDTYKRFSETAKIVSKTIVDAEKRLPLAKELYDKTAIILGLQADTSDELGAALKDGASATRIAAATPGPAPKSKVTDEMVAANLKMYPNKTRAEIIEELEPHIN